MSAFSSPSSPANNSAAFHNADPEDFLARAVAAADHVAYRWNVATDEISWTGNVSQILHRHGEVLATGKLYASLMDADNLTSRHDAVVHSTATANPDGVAFQIEYQLKSENGDAGIWVEDLGRWFADDRGRPKEVVGIVRLVTVRHEHDQKMSLLNRNDPLTGMMNRARLTEALEQASDAATRDGSPCAFFIAAINNLAVVNDVYGFEVADEVIAGVAQRLRQVMRSGDAIGRYSGSKFGTIINNCQAADINFALDRFLLAVRESVIETSLGPVWAQLSIGAVVIPDYAQDAPKAFARAEEALSRALSQPGDSFVLYESSPEGDQQRTTSAHHASNIIRCLKDGLFHLAFQPMIDASTGATVIHEVLLRMRDSAGTFVTAGHLVPVAERLGLIRLIDRAVLQLALETLHRYPEARLSVNISATTANDPRWNKQLFDMIIAAHPINDRLIIEIPEFSSDPAMAEAVAFCDKLRKEGCCVAIDDFGAGAASFQKLCDHPIDLVKLDGSYCRDLASSSEKAYFAKTLIDMARHFGIKTVAKMVETESDAMALASLGVDYLQGNYLAAPDMALPWKSEHSSVFDFAATPDATSALTAIDVMALQTREEFGADHGSEPALNLPDLAAPAPVAEETFALDSMSMVETFEASLLVADPVSPIAATPVVAEPAQHHAGSDAHAVAMLEPAIADDDVLADLLFAEVDAEVSVAQNDDDALIDDEADQSVARLKEAMEALTRHFASHNRTPSGADGERLAG